MSLKIPSDRREFAAFGSFYAQSIEPYLAAREADRLAAVRQYCLLLGASVAAGVVAYALTAADIRMQVAFATVALGAAGAGFLLKRARAKIAHGLLERISGRFGYTYRGALARPEYHDWFRRLKLLPNHNLEHWEDEVSGEYAGARFTLCEAHLRYRSSGKYDTTRTVFHGQIFIIDYHKRFSGTTILLRESGVLNALKKPGREFQRVGLASAAFEKAFEAWSTDQVEARDLLDPIVLERFQELERLFDGRQIRAAFDQGKLLIAVDTGDRLQLGTMFQPLNGAGRVDAILKEFDAIFDLIDVLLKRIDQPITGAVSLHDFRNAARV